MTRKTMLQILNALNLVPAASGGGATTPFVAAVNDSVLEQTVVSALNGLSGAPGKIHGLES